jgi:hypothetical protein
MTGQEVTRDAHVRAMLIGLLSLFLSGAGSLTAQCAIQRYVAIHSGGADAFISSAISFAFIAGIALGALLGGRSRWPRRVWISVELACACILPAFIPAFCWLLDGVMRWNLGIGSYYAVLFGLLLLTCGTLAVFMGANYPAAFATLGGSNRTAILVLVTNTLGAATGCGLSVYLLPSMSLSHMVLVASLFYVCAGLLPLLVRPQPVVSSSGSGPVSRAAALLFAAGFIGFSYQVVLFRHFGLVEPDAYWLFSVVLAFILVAWAVGNCLALIFRVPSGWILAGLALSLGATFFMLGPQHVKFFFIPVLFSGWYFGAIHCETKSLSARQAGLVYAFNLAGTFLGGLAATALLPDVFRLSFVLIPAIGAALAVVVGTIFYSRRFAIALPALAIFALGSPQAYYRDLSRTRGPVEADEDWGISTWLAGEDYLVSGRMQSPGVHKVCGGYRTQQMLIPSLLKRNSRIFYVGVGAGISNGGLVKLLPDSKIKNLDYSPAVSRFWSRHPEISFDLIHTNPPLVMDGRLALSLDHDRYNVILEITGDDGLRGSTAVKSLEFLNLVKSHLEPDGVFVSQAYSTSYFATAQKVFRHVWIFPELPMVISTDADLPALFDPSAAKKIAGKIPCLDRVLAAHGKLQRVVLLPKIDAPVITDNDPISDYAILLSHVDPKIVASAPHFDLPFLESKAVAELQQ